MIDTSEDCDTLWCMLDAGHAGSCSPIMSKGPTHMMDADRDFLVKLFEDIWTEHTDPIHGRRWSDETRSLTEHERIELLTVLERNRDQLVFEPGGGVFGFGVSLAVYEPPLYPGTGCTLLVVVTGKHYDAGSNAYNRDVAYKFVEQFTHTERNREMRDLYGFKAPLRDMAAYDY